MLKRKTLRKIIYFLLAFMVLSLAFAWIYPNYIMEIDAPELDNYYDLLSKYAKPGKELVLNLGLKESDDLQLAVDRLKSVMGFGFYDISISYNNLKEPPAYIIDAGDKNIQISLSTEVKSGREQIGVLAHEMCHIYVRNLDGSVFGGCDKERLVDCAGVFLGLGVLVLNGLTDDIFILPGEGYETEKKFFGYIKPEQFGYLFARYCAEHGIAPRDVTPFLSWTGRKYFSIGFNYLKRKGRLTGADAGKVDGAYWCSRCGSFLRSPFEKRIKGAGCAECGNIYPRR